MPMTKLNDDPARRAVVHSAQLNWALSPAAGVERRLLERDGGEQARATSVVRYAPGSAFPAHEHGGGEEFLVLDGVFCDESGDFPRGWYVRNPPGSRHRPGSRTGCVILVKLRQMPVWEARAVRIDTNDAANWTDTRVGERGCRLFEANYESVWLLRWAPGARFEECFPAGAEYFVVEGGFADARGEYPEGAWLRLPAGVEQRIQVAAGALVYRKTGHLGRHRSGVALK